MAENSKIEWTDHTFNPWIGCAKVSEGCVNCYAELLNTRYGWAEWGVNGTRKRTSEANWKKPLKWNILSGLAGVRAKVFCASLGDVFEGRADTDNMLWDLGNLITATPNLDWLLLTKRPENVMRLIGDYMAGGFAELWLGKSPNVWIGTSVENQEHAEKRIPELLRIPAHKRFLSMEPLLGSVSLKFNLAKPVSGVEQVLSIDALEMLDWVIVGGESGHGARPMHPGWAQSIRDQCVEARVPFFFKQWGKFIPLKQANMLRLEDPSMESIFHGNQWAEEVNLLSAGEVIYHGFDIGKKKAGRILDGRTWDEYPDAPTWSPGHGHGRRHSFPHTSRPLDRGTDDE